MAAFPRFSASFILVAAVLALFLSSSTVVASSNKDAKQAEYLAERDVEEKTIPSERMLGGVEDDLIALTNDIAKAQAPFQFCSVQNTYKQINCPPLLPPFPKPTYNKFVTPVVLPYANPANQYRQCWSEKGIKPASWQCGEKNAINGDYGNYPNAYVGAYIEFPSGSLTALQADVKSTAARDSIIAVMEDFVYLVVMKMLRLSPFAADRCGFPKANVFGCTISNPRYNNPQLNFGLAPDGKVRLLIIFVMDWNVISWKMGHKYTFPQYTVLVQSFFNNQANTAPLWDDAVRKVGQGTSQFLGAGSPRALKEETGEEQEGSLRKLPGAVKKPPPKVIASKVVKVVAIGGSV